MKPLVKDIVLDTQALSNKKEAGGTPIGKAKSPPETGSINISRQYKSKWILSEHIVKLILLKIRLLEQHPTHVPLLIYHHC